MKNIRLILFLLIPLFVSIFTFITLRQVFNTPVNPNETETVLFEIQSGKTFRAICKDLEEKKLVNYWWAIEVLARLKRGDAQVKAGEYELNRAMKPQELLKKLLSGEVYQRRVTLKEGQSIWEFGAELEKAGLVTKAEFDAAVVNQELLDRAGIAAKSFEGYLFPETYNFSRPIKPEEIIWRMLEEGEKRWPIEYTDQADNLRMSRHEILTLASIIEKESGVAEEQPIISSVLHNRLKQGMKLQADPTVIYGIPNFNGNLTKQDLETPTPYNTYVNFGLPPGPVGSPSETAVKAALFPQETPYLFFVADRHGRHVFSTTLEEHNEAVRQFQLAKKNDTETTP